MRGVKRVHSENICSQDNDNDNDNDAGSRGCTLVALLNSHKLYSLYNIIYNNLGLCAKQGPDPS